MSHPYQTDTVGLIYKALAEAQREIQNPVKNARNPHFKSTYTTLDEVLNVCREALSQVGIGIFQRTYMADGILMLETVLGHSSGEQLASHYPVISVPFKPQDGLSALTYARRGALCAAVGIAGEDDDGNAAQKATVINTKKPEPPAAEPQNSSKLLDEMTSGLEDCNTESELAVWTLANKANKRNLTLADQAVITKFYKQVQDRIKEQAIG